MPETKDHGLVDALRDAWSATMGARAEYLKRPEPCPETLARLDTLCGELARLVLEAQKLADGQEGDKPATGGIVVNVHQCPCLDLYGGRRATEDLIRRLGQIGVGPLK